MALTATQIAARAGKLTASRIACLMRGDAEKIDALYREMIGEAAEDDLADVWAVQLGEATEPLNLRWFERKNFPVTRRGQVVQHAFLPWAACTIDGWIEELSCPIECKHVGGREPIEVVIERYQPQMQWQMEVTGASQCALSVIIGADAPWVEFIERDAEYAHQMIKRGAQFMDCVERRVPPVTLPAVPSPADAAAIYDMTGNNAWANAAAIWIDTRAAASECRDAEKLLKELMPPDAKKATGYGVRITRDRAGRLSLRQEQEQREPTADEMALAEIMRDEANEARRIERELRKVQRGEEP